jgi:hypothetical protein
MAVNIPRLITSEGSTTKVALYRVVGVTAADTFDMSADFVKVLAAFLVITATAAASQPAISANTTLTVGAGPALDDAYLLVFGSAK